MAKAQTPSVVSQHNPRALLARLEDFPAYTEEKRKLDSLIERGKAKQVELEASIKHLQSLPKGEERLTDAANKLLAGVNGGSVSLQERDRINTDLASQKEELLVLKKAVELQTANVRQAMNQAAAKIAGELFATHLALVRRLASALVELKAAATAEEDWREVFEASGVSMAHPLRHVGFLTRGKLENYIGTWLANVRSNGYEV
jgi:hypothetical protein